MVLAPVNRVKLLLQSQTVLPRIATAKTTAPYKGILDCFARIGSKQGVAAYWRGNLVQVLGSVPSHTLAFTSKSFFSAFKPKVDPKVQGNRRRCLLNRRLFFNLSFLSELDLSLVPACLRRSFLLDSTMKAP